MVIMVAASLEISQSSVFFATADWNHLQHSRTSTISMQMMGAGPLYGGGARKNLVFGAEILFSAQSLASASTRLLLAGFILYLSVFFNTYWAHLFGIWLQRMLSR